jgi:hypothetical protein
MGGDVKKLHADPADRRPRAPPYRSDVAWTLGTVASIRPTHSTRGRQVCSGSVATQASLTRPTPNLGTAAARGRVLSTV